MGTQRIGDWVLAGQWGPARYLENRGDWGLSCSAAGEWGVGEWGPTTS